MKLRIDSLARVLLAGAALVAACAVHADQHADQSVTPGSYETANGNLDIKVQDGSTNFEITSIGANGHTCGLEGPIHDGKAELEGSDGESCVVVFKTTAQGIDVSANGACRYYCGARATFEDLYLKPAPACVSAARDATRKQFQHAYAAKDYAAARAKLEPVLTNCAGLLSWLETVSLRNDLAVTLYHLHERQACLAMLEPLAADAAKTDEALRDDYPPVDADSYLPLIKAARTNLKLCNGLGAEH